MALIVVATSDTGLSQILQQEFQRRGHQVLVAHTGQETVSLAERCHPDLVVLSPALPQLDSVRVYQQIKSTPGLAKTQVLFFSIQVQLEEEPGRLGRNGELGVQGSSPLNELTLRVDSLLHHPYPQQAPTQADHLVVGKLILHSHNKTIENNGRISTLTPIEFDLLTYLMLHADEVCPSARLLQNVWGYPPDARSTDLVRTHIRNLRQKIEDCPARPVHLRTVRHHGYMLCSQAHRLKEQSIRQERTAGSERGFRYPQTVGAAVA